MAKNLVIVESPAKAKTINKILGGDFVVKSSMGHVRDLATGNMSVDIEAGFIPKYSVVAARKKVVDDLKKAVEQCETIYLAPDPDREGEAIAWHLKEVLKRGGKDRPFLRVQYNEITPRAVRQAFEHPGEIDINRVNAQQARRVLDRIVGYMVSPLLWRTVRRGLSAGRVQSVALRLVCEREQEILAFKPEEFWILGALVRKLVDPKDPFPVKLVRINDEKADIKTEDQARQIRTELEGRSLKVGEIATREVNKSAPPPYITSTLQQAGSTWCGYSPKRTMAIAQKLYEGVDLGEGPVGLITYMRTDSFAIAQDALQAARQYITQTFGAEYCPEKPNFFRNRSSAQEAHEAIRPTDVSRTPDRVAQFLDPTELKLYRLIWQRSVASQMAPARLLQRTAKIEAVPNPGQANTYLFQASSSDVIFPGYMKVSSEEFRTRKPGEEETDEVDKLPPLTQGEMIECMEWLAERKETQPPSRYSEASLIRALESNGVGRPSTYAQIITTLQTRTYVELRKKALFPTALGMQVNTMLVTHLEELFNVSFTASMEESLDEIEKGTVEWHKMLADFYAKFQVWVARVKIPSANRAVVEKVLAALEVIKEWQPEVQRGKKKYSDEKFVASVRKQLVDAQKEISQRQLDALARIAARYRGQLADVNELLTGTGLEGILAQTPQDRPVDASTLRKLQVLKAVPLDESARKFVDSLGSRAEGGRNLSEAQLRALNGIVMMNSQHIPEYEAIKAELQVGEVPTVKDDFSKILLEALVDIQQWKAPVTRGRKVFDDHAFYNSLSEHFTKKGFLSDRQRVALKKLVERYRDQVTNYESIMKQYAAMQRELMM